MTERSFAPATNQAYKPQNLYMRIIVTKLNRKKIVTKEDARFVFAMYKGEEEYDRTSQIAVSRDVMGEIGLTDVSVDFVLINYNPQSRYKFSLRMAEVKEKVIKEIGEYLLETNRYIDQYLMSEHGVFQETINLCDEFQAEIEFFVDNSQYGLQRLIRDIKNPKPKKEGDFEDPKISHKRITELRRKMDDQYQVEEHVHKEQRFKRFSPRKDVSEQKHKKEEFINNKKNQVERKAQQEEARVIAQKEEEEKKKKNREFVPKKQWIIPQAEQLMNKSKARQLKRKSSKEDEKPSTNKSKPEDIKQMKRSREKPKLEEESFLEKLPVNPKILFAIIAILILAGGYFFFRGDSSQVGSNVPIFPQVKGDKKEKAKHKAKKGKK